MDNLKTLATVRNMLSSLEGYTGAQATAANKIRNAVTVYQDERTENARGELVATATAQSDLMWGLSGAVSTSIDIIKQLVADLEAQK